MKYVRFLHNGVTRWGFVAGSDVVPLVGDPFHGRTEGEGKFPLAEVTLLAPFPPGGKVIAVGINYRDHAGEMGHDLPAEPVIFLKSPTAVIGPGEPIVIPLASRRVDYEAELAAVIGRRAYKVPVASALDHVFGYTCCNDVTARDLQKQDGQWARAKSFNTFCPLGPWVVTGIDPGNLKLELYLNGEIKQYSTTANLIFPVAHLVAFISGVMPLEPGDIVSTGTPVGVGPLRAGDRVEVVIAEIGKLSNPVVREEGAETDGQEV